MIRDAIQRKRDGHALSTEELRGFLDAYLAGDVADYHMAAFLMAVYFRGLDTSELSTLVDAMIGSGAVADLSSVPGRKIDKHSTGGVGDKVSLILAPLVASLGVAVPMMSGRGLGHTGGTIDKLETIPGFRTDLDMAAFRAQMERLGCALIAQTSEIAPLDGRLYALRDVTATVESIPLIASSIMSKKLAEGIDGLVLDVKIGNGAFLPERDRAESLARTMIGIGRARGCEVIALLTAMDRPLGNAVGNALEVEEAVLTLRGEGPGDLREVTVALAAEMLAMGDVAPDEAEGRRLAEGALDDGRALEKMREIIHAQGGNSAVLDDPAILPQAAVRRAVAVPVPGRVLGVDTRAIGRAAVALGAGRRRLEDAIRPGVGFHITAKPGDVVAAGERIATVYADSAQDAERGVAAVLAAVEIGEGDAEVLPLIAGRLVG